jgi:glyceraldehyde 3-phosphate dehydrogenase
MTVKIGINGFGRMGRLGLRAGWAHEGTEITHINEPAGTPDQAAHLLEFDSVHGRWQTPVGYGATNLDIDGTIISYGQETEPAQIPWGEFGVDIVVECSGQFRTPETLQPHFDQGARKVVVAAPIKGEGALNIVMGVNDHLYDTAKHQLVTAASCTTNCLAPIVKVLLEHFEIKHGVITTIHDVTNTQVMVDGFHKDLRRARSGINSLIPTTTGSATAITQIYPELEGKLNGHAVRVPLLNGSLTDCVFEVDRKTSPEEINGYFEQAAQGKSLGGSLKDILGFETRPLVSADFVDDPRSSIVDALSTMVVDGTQIKIFAWYDNEWGYVNRLMELVQKIAAEL